MVFNIKSASYYPTIDGEAQCEETFKQAMRAAQGGPDTFSTKMKRFLFPYKTAASAMLQYYQQNCFLVGLYKNMTTFT